MTDDDPVVGWWPTADDHVYVADPVAATDGGTTERDTDG